MHQKVKLTRRQLKEDKFTSFMLRSKGWFAENWQFAVIGVVALILVVVAGVYYSNSRVADRAEASTKFAQALSDFRRGNNQVAVLGMQQILEEYGGTSVAEQATFLLGKLHYSMRNYPEAIRYFDMYLSKYRDDLLMRSAAMAGIAGCEQDQGNYTVAAAKFNEAYEAYPDGPLTGDYRYSAMRNLLMAGETEQAREILEFIESEYEGTELVNRATLLFAEKSQG